LLGYLIRITEVDPMEYDLLFERFLNPARVSMPDIDTDFEDSERDKILEYCKQKY
jgi:DNA polymerase-3 subunit alpha